MGSYECEYMTVFECRARDFAKDLMLQEMIEGSDTYTELSNICKEQCCRGCDKSCGYRCNKKDKCERDCFDEIAESGYKGGKINGK